MEKLVLIGAGGHCKSVLDLLSGQYDIFGITDADSSRQDTLFYGVEVLGDDGELQKLFNAGITNALVTLGSIRSTKSRERLYCYASTLGFNLINAISVNSIISPSARLGKGNTVMDRAIIHADTVIGDNNIINSAAVIEHDCIIGSHIHISPGAMIAGGVRIGNGSHIGIGASIIQGIEIGENCVIGAGAVVINNIPGNCLCVGVPARVIKHISREVNNEG